MSKIMSRFLLLGWAFLCVSCATEPDTLQLESVMSARPRYQAYQDPVEVDKLSSRDEMPPAPEKTFLVLSSKPETEVASTEDVKSSMDLMVESDYTPRELAFLSLPDGFKQMTDEEAKGPAFKTLLKEVDVDNPIIWFDQEKYITVLAGTSSLSDDAVSEMTQSDLKKQLWAMGDSIIAYYRQKYGSPAATKVEALGSSLVLRVDGKYVQMREWWSDHRHVYFYNSDYRLTVVLWGKDKDIQTISSELSNSFRLFEKRLSEHFKDGIKGS